MNFYKIGIQLLKVEYPDLGTECIIGVVNTSPLAALAAIDVVPLESYTQENFDPLNHVDKVDLSEKSVHSFFPVT